jgi:hypothetical protein
MWCKTPCPECSYAALDEVIYVFAGKDNMYIYIMRRVKIVH